MLKSLHTFVRKAAAAFLLTAAGTLPMLAAEPETPQSMIHPEWEYTYYNDFLFNNHINYLPSKYQKCGFTEEKEIDGKNYWLFSLMTEAEEDGTPTVLNLPLAYMREENGRVYMRLHPETPERTKRRYDHRDTYGYRDRELLIYDFNLKSGEAYQIGEADTHPVYHPEHDAEIANYKAKELLIEWMMETEWENPYSYLFVWDDGRLSVSDVREDETLGRRVWFMHQKCSYPELIYWPEGSIGIVDELDTDFETTHTRILRFIEGIGCNKSFLPFPGLYIPTYKTLMAKVDNYGSPLLCEIKDKKTGEIIYQDPCRPDKDNSVDSIGTDSENAEPEYHTLQGMRMQNPAPGEICIVRRGAKVTKEVIAR